VPRLQRVIVEALADGRVDAAALVTHRYDIADAAAAYAMLDTDASRALQVVLEFP
jgi:threonine dehydrogenase-like Zn-dependent dehydrogenase